MKTLRYVVQLALGIVLPLLVQRWDRRRLSPEQGERAWNGASWAAALYAFGPLSMLGWCWVTRQGTWLATATWLIDHISKPSTRGPGRARRGLTLGLAFVISFVVGLLVGVAPVLFAIYALDYAVGSSLGLKVDSLW